MPHTSKVGLIFSPSYIPSHAVNQGKIFIWSVVYSALLPFFLTFHVKCWVIARISENGVNDFKGKDVVINFQSYYRWLILAFHSYYLP